MSTEHFRTLALLHNHEKEIKRKILKDIEDTKFQEKQRKVDYMLNLYRNT